MSARTLLAICFFWACPAAATAQQPPAGPHRATLENGLQVIQRPIKGARQTAIVVVFRLGEAHDPPGQSGMGHLLEHLYATAPAGKAPSRTIEQIGKRYGEGWNFQTGEDYTIAAVVVPNDAIAAELREAADRMASLRPTRQDLAREIPRMNDELRNMFERVPQLAAANLAREAVLPSRHGGRKGGLPAQIATISLEELQARLDQYYKPRNAILALAGGIDPASLTPLIQKVFGGIPPGRELEPPPGREPPMLPVVLTQTTKAGPDGPNLRLCLAYAAPGPASQDFPPFLLQLARLTRNAPRLGMQLPVQYRPLDDPACLLLNLELRPTQDPQMVLAQVDELVKAVTEAPLNDSERSFAERQFGLLLGTAETADQLLAGNPYGVAFSLARRAHLGVSPPDLVESIKKVSQEDLARVAGRWLNAQRRAAVILRSE